MPFCKPFALALSLIPACLVAQESSADSAYAFHGGQWAAQFGVTGYTVYNVGVLKFTSPHSAWLLLFDFSGNYRNGTQTITGTTSNIDEHSVFFSTMLGRRFYQAPRHKLRSFQSIGLSGSYTNQKQTYSGTPPTTYSATDWSAGLFGELGAGYFVTPNLSLGATGNLRAGYTRRTTDQFNNQSAADGWYVSGVDVRFIVGLYF